MATQLRAAELLTLDAAWKMDNGIAKDEDFAMAKLHAFGGKAEVDFGRLKVSL